MTKTELILALEKSSGISHKTACAVVDATFEMMILSIYKDQRIEVRGFGSFSNRSYKAYDGRNPKSGNYVKVKPKKVPFFRPGKDVKEMVDKGKSLYLIKDN